MRRFAMTNEQLEARVKELEAENKSLRIKLEQKNTRNAGRKPRINEREIERMKKMRDEGKSYAFIGQVFGVSSTSVYNKLKSSDEEFSAAIATKTQ